MLDIPQERIDWRAKGFWLPDASMTAAEVAAGRPGIFDGGFTWPLLVIRDSAVRANIATMAAYAARHGMDFAPHAKTTMAPALLAAQLEAGAWGMTVATPNQALILRKLGVPRVLIANEVLDPAALCWLAGQTAAGWEVYFQVDSVAGVGPRPRRWAETGVLRVLVELGHSGGRTGARTVDDLAEVARAAAGVDRLDLVGVTGLRGPARRSGRGGRVPRPAGRRGQDAVRRRSAAGAADRVGRRQRVVRPGGGPAGRRRSGAGRSCAAAPRSPTTTGTTARRRRSAGFRPRGRCAPRWRCGRR